VFGFAGPWGQELLLLSGYGKDGHPHGGVPKVSQETVDEMIGNRHRPLTHHFFKNKFRTLGFIQVQRKSPDQHFSLFDDQFIEVGGSGRSM
jgi:hypothetical protein